MEVRVERGGALNDLVSQIGGGHESLVLVPVFQVLKILVEFLHGWSWPLAGIQVTPGALNDGKCFAEFVPIAEVSVRAVNIITIQNTTDSATLR